MRLALPPAGRVKVREELLEAGRLLCLLVDCSSDLAKGGKVEREIAAQPLQRERSPHEYRRLLCVGARGHRVL